MVRLSSSPLKFWKPSRCWGAHNRRMRIADAILMDSDNDFSGSGQLQRRGRGSYPRFECFSPRSLIGRWLRKSKGRKFSESEKVVRESRRDGLERGVCGGRKEEVGCSMNGQNREPLSFVPELEGESPIAEVSGQYRKEDCFNLAVGFGLFSLISASKNELDKMMKLRMEMEVLLQNVKEEFYDQNGKLLSKPSETNEIPARSTVHAQESLFSNGHVLTQTPLSYKSPADSKTFEFCDHSLYCNSIGQEKRMEGIDQLEAELEAELERLQIHLDTEDFIECPKQQIVEVTVVEGSTSQGSLNASFGEVVDLPEAGTEEHYGVPPNELERRLHELLESRQQERITELETALECANQKLCEKEREVCWWKDTARLISQHVTKKDLSHLGSEYTKTLKMKC